MSTIGNEDHMDLLLSETVNRPTRRSTRKESANERARSDSESGTEDEGIEKGKNDSEIDREKITRKGKIKSCTECRRLKLRCIRDTHSNAWPCIPCQKRRCSDLCPDGTANLTSKAATEKVLRNLRSRIRSLEKELSDKDALLALPISPPDSFTKSGMNPYNQQDQRQFSINFSENAERVDKIAPNEDEEGEGELNRAFPQPAAIVSSQAPNRLSNTFKRKRLSPTSTFGTMEDIQLAAFSSNEEQMSSSSILFHNSIMVPSNSGASIDRSTDTTNSQFSFTHEAGTGDVRHEPLAGTYFYGIATA